MAPHPHELPEMGDTHLHLDVSANGLGGASCGQGGPLAHCRSYAHPQRFGFVIRPYEQSKEDELTSISTTSQDVPVLIERNDKGVVTLSHVGKGTILYSINGAKAKAYTQPFELSNGGEIRAWLSTTPTLKSYMKYLKSSNVALKVLYASSEEINDNGHAANLLDKNPSTIWHSTYAVTVAQYPHWIDFDMQEVQGIKGFTFLPRQDESDNGLIKDYSIEVSTDGKNWSEAYKGRFDTKKSLKRVEFGNTVKARYIRFKALSSHAGHDFAAGSEFSVISAQ